MISIHGLTFHYPDGESLLDDFTLEVLRGDLFGLVGPNGAGKSTLISLICGLTKPCAGTIRIAGSDLSHDRETILQTIALVPQDYAFYPKLSARENLGFFAHLYPHLPNPRQRIDHVMEMTGITGFAHRPAHTYSGGMKRRLNLAIGLLNQPALLILDEPTVGIDPQSRNFILQSIQHINEEGTTVLYTSHYMEEVERLCNRVAVMDHGRILVQGKLEEILGRGVRFRARLSDSSAACVETAASLLQAYGLSLDGDGVTGELAEPGLCVEVADTLRKAGIHLDSLYCGQESLETLFFDLTHKDLRDS